MQVKSEREVPQSFPTLRDPMNCSLPGSSVHGIFQARVLEWGAIAFSEQVSFYFMTLVTVHGDFGAQENSLSLLPLLFSRKSKILKNGPG